jgi:general secretion pathway protein K
MTTRGNDGEVGAALVIVLLLVATLSFILLSITGIVTASVNRSASDRARAEMLWRAFAAEEIAEAILEKYLATAPVKMAPNEGVFGAQIDVPFANGTGAIVFNDATRCFNLNTLANGGATVATEVDNLTTLLESIGLGGGEARKAAEVVADFIDEDFQPQGQGVEDNFYTALPTPFRTAGGPIASISELRAMDGFNRDLYRRIRPYLCARDTGGAQINFNFLTEDHAPLVYALQGNPWTTPLDAIKAGIKAIPPGGATALPQGFPPMASTSGMIEARVRLEVNDRTMEETLLFKIAGADAILVARSFGDGI